MAQVSEQCPRCGSSLTSESLQGGICLQCLLFEGLGDSGREVLIGLTHRLAGDHDAAFRALEALLPELKRKLEEDPKIS